MLAAAVAGCSVLKPSDKTATKISGSAATEITPASTPGNIAPSATTPEPTVQETAPAMQLDTTAEDMPDMAVNTLNTALARSLGGEWTIFQVGTTSIDRDEDMPYIIFEPSTGRFYANNGCNTLNGAYSVEGDKLIFSNVLSTLRMCPDAPFDSDINAIISEAAPADFKISEAGNDSFLDFLSPDGRSVMRLRRGNMQFLNGQWDVESISGLPSLEAPAQIFFDLGELRLHGDTGCNIVNGNIYLDFRKSNAVDFSNMMTTRMACPFDRQQTAMLVALEQTESAVSDGNDKVILLDNDGKVLMTLKRATAVYDK